MTRQHFVAIAATVKASLEVATTHEARASVQGLAVSLSDEFHKFNPNFDGRRFLHACGVRSNFITGEIIK